MSLSPNARSWIIQLAFFVIMGAMFGVVTTSLDVEPGFWGYFVYFGALAVIYESIKYLLKNRRGSKATGKQA